MADLLIDGASDDDMDAVILTKLANRLANRIPRLCELKTVYDGEELVPGQHVPKSVKTEKARDMYRRNMHIASHNVARPMVDSVTVRQRPNGFRLISDTSQRSVAADKMWRQCHMGIKARDLFALRNLYGKSYAFISGITRNGSDYVRILSPWECIVDTDGSSALVYSYDETLKQDKLFLYRMGRNEATGVPNNMYVRKAVKEADSRSLPSSGDDQAIYDLANGDSDKTYRFDPGYKWDSKESQGTWNFAVECQSLPIVEFSTADGRGLFEPHLQAIYRIDQQGFDLVCIEMMQAFIQRGLTGIKRTTYAESDPAVISGNAKVGDPIDMSEMYMASPGGLWMLPDGVDVWESKQTDIGPLRDTIRNDIRDLADLSMTPLGINSSDVGGSASGADLKREGVIFKAQDLNERADDGLVTLMKMALTLNGENVADNDFETMWLPINPIQYADPAQSASQLANVLPRESIWTTVLGFTEQQVMEARRQQDTQLLDNGVSMPTDATSTLPDAGENTTANIPASAQDDGIPVSGTVANG